MARSSIAVFQDLPNVQGLEKLTRMLAGIPDGLIQACGPALEKSAEQLLELQKSVCPVNDLDPTPGALRDSGHVEDAATGTGIAKAVIFDARDEKGRFIGKHVEHGHTAKDGAHVPPVPFFWPAYQFEKKRIRARVSRAMSEAVKARTGNGG